MTKRNLIQQNQAAFLLEGKILEDGWVVGKQIANKYEDRGGVYSCCYEVSNGERKGFLKAFDYSGAEKAGVKDTAEYLKNILNAFTLEKKILDLCTNSKCKNVIRLLSHGGLIIEEARYPKVEYLILEFAEKGDLQSALEENNQKMEWKLRSLHQLCKGLNQIHKLNIAHQDLKPQNIVITEESTKISDFGSAMPIYESFENLPEHLKSDYCGTWAYAPPDLLYGEVHDDPITSRIGCDIYLLGSMIVYYFTNINMTALIKDNLAPELCWTNWKNNYGKYKEVLPFLIQAFEESLDQIRKEINDKDVEEKVILMIRYLCHPDPTRRGHQKNINGTGENYDLNRFITMFDVLARHYYIKNK